MSDPGRPGRPPRTWPDRIPADPELAARLNREWQITLSVPAQPSLKQRLARPLRQALGVLFRPQETFNSAVVQQLNRLNQANDVTADRHEILQAAIDDLLHRTAVLFDRVEELGRAVAVQHAELDDARRFPESVAARDRRVEAGMTALRSEHAELRTAVGVLQHETRHLAKAAAVTQAATGPRQPAALPVAAPAAVTGDPLSHKYVGFEDAFRGSPEAIRAGLAGYVPLFAGASDVLDVGCGRGEFLSLLRDAGIRARGIDLNEAMVEVCRSRGLEATVADALAFLREQPDSSLGGVFAAQVVEHLQPGYLTQFLDAAFEKLRPGALIVLETINPACWFAFFESYIRDITHERALHPDTLTFLLVASGFQQAEIRYSAPYPAHEKLQPVAATQLSADAAETLNANVEKMNRLLFTYLDYAAIARRP